MQEAYHPNVNEQNRRVNELPDCFSEGNVIARRDPWANEETSHWVVRDVQESDIEADAGWKYRLHKVEDGEDKLPMKYISHGELQIAAARNQIRITEGDA